MRQNRPEAPATRHDLEARCQAPSPAPTTIDARPLPPARRRPAAAPRARGARARAAVAPAANVRRIGLLAGSGNYPIYFARGARQCGYEVVVVAIEQEADPLLARHVDEIHWVGVGLLETILRTFRDAGVSEVVLTGKIHKTHLFAAVEMDPLMAGVIRSLQHKDDLSLLLAIIREFERAGVVVREPTAFLKNLQAAPGVLTRRTPTTRELEDVRYGVTVAKHLANHGIGQTVVVRDGVILAVEAIEGTDKTILRAGGLVPDETVVVKVGCPNQDRRFDMPVVGMDTLRTLREAHVGVLAIDAANTVIVDKESVVAEADRHGISIVAV
jgi:DUF1009 family protein